MICRLIPSLLVLALLEGCICKFNTEGDSGHIVHTGDTARLLAPPGLKTAYVALAESDCYKLQSACAEIDERVLRPWVESGKAFTVEPGVRVTVLKDHYNERKIRILEGPLEGREGWVPFEWLKTPQPGER